MINNTNFVKAFSSLISNEGGYVNDPKDPGGETKFGISKRSYPSLNIKEITLEKARDIYYQDFWLPCSCNDMDYSLAFEVFDAAVNHGVTRSIMFLQQSLGVADDGKIGPITKKVLSETSYVYTLLRFQAYRLTFFTKLSTWESFGKGWARRVADNLIRDAENLKDYKGNGE